jgi:prepilin-type N-terminal cleavage/methylation domain-containing protein
MLKNIRNFSGNKITARNPLSQITGFTLIELIASLVLLGLLTAIFGMGLVAAMKSNEFNRANVQLAQKGQLAMARITRELMELTQIEAISNAAAGEDPYIVYNRLLEDNEQAVGRFAIHFNPTDRTLRLYTGLTITPPLNNFTIGQGDILLDGVAAFALTYFQGGAAWTWGSDPRLLSSIGISLQMQRPDDPARSQDFNTVVYLRNTNNFGGAAPTTTPATANEYSCFMTTVLDEYGYLTKH